MTHKALGAVLGAVLVTVALPLPAAAQDPVPVPESVSTASRYQVTFAARACGSYGEVMGNRVLDDRVESASAPGRTSAYRDGQPVDPAVEAANGSGCAALPGWRFTFGAGTEKKGSLSTVSAAAGDVGPTVAEVPRLDGAGRPNGSPITGAVTVTLDEDQLILAARRQLWVQGGTPADPLLAKANPDLGFGALRCGVDGRAGTNTQWIAFPAGVRHVFCYAYYVRRAPAAATLLIRARTSEPVGYPQRFTFDTTASYTAAKQVVLATSGGPVDAALVRGAGGAARRVTPRVPAGWALGDASCVASGAGRSTRTVDTITGTADVTLTAGEVVTCTFTFKPPATPAGLAVRVVADVPGAFGVTINGEGGPRALTASPAGDGSAVAATGADLSTLLPGAYTITIAPPAGAEDRWSLAGANCGGEEIKPDAWNVPVTLPTGVATDCVVRVAHRAPALNLRAVTVGGIGAVAYSVVPLAEGVPGWAGVATTTGVGVSAPAQGDLPSGVPFGSYLVTPLPPPSTVDGSWTLSSFACDLDASTIVPGGGAEVVPLDPNVAEVTCTVTYRFTAATRLRVALRFAGEPTARSDAAAIDIACVDGSRGRVVLPVDDLGERDLPTPLGFLDPTECTVQRPDDGAAQGAKAAATAVLDPAPGNAPLSLPGTVELTRDVAEYRVTVTLTFSGSELEPTEARPVKEFDMLPIVLIGAGLVGIGLVILLVMVTRSRNV